MRLLAAAVLLGAAVTAFAQTDRVVSIEFTNSGLVPGWWLLEIHPDGSGHFHSKRGNAPRGPGEWIEPPDVDRDVRVSERFAAHVFEVAQEERWFQKDCDSHAKVAFQGTKRLSYKGPEGAGECSFNFSRDKVIQGLGDSLVATATTIVQGARLEQLLQHDPLGLDAAIGSLTEMADDGRAQEIETIKPTLERLAEDEAVMERVRKRARGLLAKAEL